VNSRKNFSNGPVWDPERGRYFVEIRFPDGSRKKKRFRRSAKRNAVEPSHCLQRGQRIAGVKFPARLCVARAATSWFLQMKVT
jgi:hypothetical protein